MFDFFTVSHIRFGAGTSKDAASIAASFGKQVLLVTDGRVHHQTAASIEAQLREIGLCCNVFDAVNTEPTPELVDAAAAAGVGCDVVLAIGGGSVIDTGKAAAGLIPNGGPVQDYLEGVGTGRQMINDPLPFIAMPTTAGTGAEVTKNAVISSHQPIYKKSFRHEKLLARAVIVDPELAVSLPPAQTAYSGMDALTQLIECFLTRKHNPISDALSLQGMRMAVSALPKVYVHGEDIQARGDMALCALMSGIAMTNAGLGAVHGIAASLGAHLGIGHGLACALMLPHVLRLNRPAVPKRMAQVDDCLGGTAETVTAQLNADFGIAADLKAYSITSEQLALIACDSAGSSMNGNPVQLDAAGWEAFLSQLI